MQKTRLCRRTAYVNLFAVLLQVFLQVLQHRGRLVCCSVLCPPLPAAAAAAHFPLICPLTHSSSLAVCVCQVKDDAFISAEAWQALGHSAGDLLSAGSTLSYIGPVFALFGYAIKQWSTCQEVPQEAVELLESCKWLIVDLNGAWPHIMLQAQQQQQQQQQQRQQRPLRWLQPSVWWSVTKGHS
jgi:hypothetical protein